MYYDGMNKYMEWSRNVLRSGIGYFRPVRQFLAL